MREAAAFFRERARFSWWEIAFWLAWVAMFFVPGANLALLVQVLIWGLRSEEQRLNSSHRP